MTNIDLGLRAMGESERLMEALRESEAVLQADIDQHKRREAELTKETELFSSFLRHSPIYVYIKAVTPTESRVLRVSDNFGELTGIPAAEMVGKTMQDIFPPDFAAQVTADDWGVVAGGQLRRLEERLAGRTFSTSKFPLVLGGETLLGGYTIDITEQRQAEQARHTREQQFVQTRKRESLGVMAGGVAQQLNLWLTTTQGSLELARADASPSVDDLLAEAAGAVQQAAGVSGSLLSYLGQRQHRRRPRHLGREVSAMFPRLRAAAPPSVRLALEVALDVPVCTVDTSELQDVIVILVTNAWEAIEGRGGTVRIAVRRSAAVPANAEPVDAPSDRGWACVEVSDDGPGMDGETRQRIFEPFFTTKRAGRGLGLPVVQGMVRASGGTVAVESAPGRGTTVKVYLPETQPEPPTKPWRAAAPELDLGDGRRAPDGAVLLVDDDAAVLRACQRIMRRLGLEVVSVENGAEALEVFSTRGDAIGSVLLDLGLPDMDGWQVLTGLRQLRPDVFVVVASGYDLTELRETVREHEPDGWLQKPFPIADLAAMFAPTRARLSAD